MLVLNESPLWGSCRLYSIGNWVCVCVYVCECKGGRDRGNGCEGQVSPCTVGHSLTFHCFHFSAPPLFPSSVSLLQHPAASLSIFAGGIWFHDGQLGLRGSHHDWRIVHLQPQGGGPHLPGLPRWHRVCFDGAALPLTFLKICGLRVGDKGEIQSRWKG